MLCIASHCCSVAALVGKLVWLIAIAAGGEDATAAAESLLHSVRAQAADPAAVRAIKAAVAVFADAGRSIKEFMAEVVAAFTANITLLAEGACPIEVNYVKLDAAGIAAAVRLCLGDRVWKPVFIVLVLASFTSC